MSLAVSGTNLFAGTSGGCVFLSTNDGTSWVAVNSGLTDSIVPSLAVIGTNVFAGTRSGIFLTTNSGVNWMAVNAGLPPIMDIPALSTVGINLLAATYPGGVFLSSDNGTSWTSVDSGLSGYYVLSFAISGTNLFAGTRYTDGVWRRPLSEMITSVETMSSKLPAYFSLCQNYPNPFNPGTVIQFNLLRAGYVTLIIFSTLGEEIATLVSERLPAGSYTPHWNPTNVASGVYFYRLTAGSSTETKMLVLVR